MWMWIAVPIVLLTVFIIGPLMIAFGGFSVEDTMPSEDSYDYTESDEEE